METPVGYERDSRSTSPLKKEKKKKEERTVTLPSELIFFDILTRLPVKSLLQFRSVSKLWCSHISSPLFVNLHLARSLSDHLDGFALLISTYDRHSSEQHLLSASHRDGQTIHLLTLSDSTKHHDVSENINGLLCLHRPNAFMYWNPPNAPTFCNNSVYICNPCTREIVKLPVNFQMPVFSIYLSYNFGFESSRNEYKVLTIRVLKARSTEKDQIVSEIFTLGTDNWRKIPVFPFDDIGYHWLFNYRESVCVNDAMHWLLCSRGIIVAFDLRDENFRVIPLPQADIASDKVIHACGIGISTQSYMVQMNGLLTVICHEHVMEQNMIEVWILEDYQNHVWMLERITFPSPWADLACPFPNGTIYKSEILLVPNLAVWNWISKEFVSVLFYDMKKKNFRRVKITSVPKQLSSNMVEIRRVGVYSQSMLSCWER